jgi:hypothetical protein
VDLLETFGHRHLGLLSTSGHVTSSGIHATKYNSKKKHDHKGWHLRTDERPKGFLIEVIGNSFRIPFPIIFGRPFFYDHFPFFLLLQSQQAKTVVKTADETIFCVKFHGESI